MFEQGVLLLFGMSTERDVINETETFLKKDSNGG